MPHREFAWKSDCFGCGDLFNINLWRMAIAEFVGTFVVTFVGLFTKVATLENFTPSLERQGFGWGLSVASMMLVINHISGGHLNPAISIGLIFTGDSSIVRAIIYTIMQVAGGLLAGLLFKYCLPTKHVGDFAVLWHNHRVPPEYGMVTEACATVPLLLLFASLKDTNRVDFRGSGALAVGLYYVAAHQCFWYFTGACLNPVRALSPAFASEIWKHQWVYWAGPITGALLGGIIYPLFFKVSKELLEENKAKLVERQKYFCPPDLRPPKPKPTPEEKKAEEEEKKKKKKEDKEKQEEEKKKEKEDKKKKKEEDAEQKEEEKEKKKKKKKKDEEPEPEEEDDKKKKKK